MTHRVILAPVFGDAADAVTLDGGVAVARGFQAHLATLFVRIDPRDAIPIIGEGVSPAVIDQLTQATAAEMERQRDHARAAFKAACTTAGIAVADAPLRRRVASAGWTELTGRRDQIIPRRARASDLVVFGRGAGDASPNVRAAFEATLFGAGRPLLLVPPSAPPPLGERVAIAWNGSAEAARAAAGVAPFLDEAKSVQVLTAKTWRTELAVAGDLVEYLAWRGVVAESRTIEAGEQPVAQALLQAAREAGADLFVMGGYGRTASASLCWAGSRATFSPIRIYRF